MHEVSVSDHSAPSEPASSNPTGQCGCDADDPGGEDEQDEEHGEDTSEEGEPVTERRPSEVRDPVRLADGCRPRRQFIERASVFEPGVPSEIRSDDERVLAARSLESRTGVVHLGRPVRHEVPVPARHRGVSEREVAVSGPSRVRSTRGEVDRDTQDALLRRSNSPAAMSASIAMISASRRASRSVGATETSQGSETDRRNEADSTHRDVPISSTRHRRHASRRYRSTAGGADS